MPDADVPSDAPVGPSKTPIWTQWSEWAQQVLDRLDAIVGLLAMQNEHMGLLTQESDHEHVYFIGSDTCATCGAPYESGEDSQEHQEGREADPDTETGKVAD